jgi:hypothetical protein
VRNERPLSDDATSGSISEPQLSVRSAKARGLSHRLARYEHRSVAEVVERALEMYQARQL